VGPSMRADRPIPESTDEPHLEAVPI